MKILVAGFQHETNTFAPNAASYENFLRGEGCPALCRGAELLALADVNVSMGGFLRAIEPHGHEVAPAIWASASPSGRVTADAYEGICGEVVRAASEDRPDAIYLDLHGAMVTGHLDDGEGELLKRLRAVVGPDVPIVVTLDLHANVSEAMLLHADVLIACRTYPHVDLAETGRRAAATMQRLLSGQKLATAWRRISFLIPILAGCTLLDPACEVYEQLAVLEQNGLTLSFAQGFPAADVPYCAPMVWGHGTSAVDVERAVSALFGAIMSLEPCFAIDLPDASAAVEQALDHVRSGIRPVVIADAQDNPGSGGRANTMGLIRKLVEHDVPCAVAGLIFDPAAAAAAHRAGVGAELEITLGEAHESEPALAGSFIVEKLTSGRCTYKGPMLTGTEVNLGQTAILRVGGVRVVVTSTVAQTFDRELLESAGVALSEMDVIVLKSAVHFRADFSQLAARIITARAPGPFKVDPAAWPWRNLPPTIRRRPRDTVPVALTTPFGEIQLAVNAREAPETAARFLELIRSGKWDGGSFRRAVRSDRDREPPIDVVQAWVSDPSVLDEKAPFESTQETGLRHLDGTISLPRFDINSGSAGSFFICIGDQPSLDHGGRRHPDGHGFAAFGRVTSGMDAVRRIASRPTRHDPDFPHLGSEWLIEPVRIGGATIVP